MSDLKKTVGEIADKLGIKLTYYPENSRPCDAPVCDKQFETVADDGEYTYFRFLYKRYGGARTQLRNPLACLFRRG